MTEYVITYVVENKKKGFAKHYETLTEALKEFNDLSEKGIESGWYVKKTIVDDSELKEKRINTRTFDDIWISHYFKPYERIKDEIISTKEQFGTKKTSRKPRKKGWRTRKNS